jgi:hypothetical protein
MYWIFAINVLIFHGFYFVYVSIVVYALWANIFKNMWRMIFNIHKLYKLNGCFTKLKYYYSSDTQACMCQEAAEFRFKL